MSDLNEATTKPYEDYRCFIPIRPMFYEIFLELLKTWKGVEHFYDLSVGKRFWEVEFKRPACEGKTHPDWAKIKYQLGTEQRLNPVTGVHEYYLKCDMSDVTDEACRQLMATLNWEFVIKEKTTCLRGSKVGKTLIWTYTEDGLSKINRVGRDIHAAGTLKQRLLAGEL